MQNHTWDKYTIYCLCDDVQHTLESLKDQFDFAAENYRMVTKQFQYGLADSLDVMDANNLLVTSELDLARAQYDYYFAMLQLRRATGTLLDTVIVAY